MRSILTAACILASGCALSQQVAGITAPGTLAATRDHLIAPDDSTPRALLRSPGSHPTLEQRVGAWPIAELALAGNNGFPSGGNDGAMWAARGTSADLRLGFGWQRGPWLLLLAPEATFTKNREWVAFDIPSFYGPQQHPDRSILSAPWYRLPHSLDMPWRFGRRALTRFDPGQSTLRYRLDSRLDVGLSSENEWWGPGIRNALLLSSNAPGVPHFFARTAKPARTFGGFVEARWLLGVLAESPWFDTVSTNNRRAFSGAAVTWRRRPNDGIAVGLARVAIATLDNGWSLPTHALDVLRPRTKVTLRDSSDIAGRSGRDAMTSLFLHWSMPTAGTEVYAELGRLELPASLRDAILAPNFTRAYTVGFQYTAPRGLAREGWHVELEASNLEQEASTLNRAGRIWYTSPTVSQGFTQRGQVLGAYTGPGSSSQWLAVDYLRPDWRIGIVGQRIRSNTDAMYAYFKFPPGLGWCEYDVTLAPGARGDLRTRWGTVAAEMLLQNRMNYFFQNASGCPRGGSMRDLRNIHVGVTWSPAR